MNYVPVSYVKNYLPKPLKDRVADDDQLYSWALQAWRALKFPNLRYTRDISFFEVKNHKARISNDIKSIIGIEVNVTDPTVEELNELCNIDLPSNNSFAQACPKSYLFFIDSCYYKNNWQTVSFVGNYVPDYLCRVQNGSSNEVYSVDPTDDRLLSFSFKEGLIAVRHWGLIKNEFGEILIPDEPEELWMYLAAYIKEMYWEEDSFFGTNADMMRKTQKKEQAKLEKAGYFSATKRNLIFRFNNLKTASELTYGSVRLIKLPSFLHRYYSNLFTSNAGRPIIS